MYEFLWRNKWLTAEAHSIPEMVELLRDAAEWLERVHQTGEVTLRNADDLSDDYAFLVTENQLIADGFGFLKEDEELDLDYV